MAAPLRLVIAQHQSDAPPGLLGDWAAAAGLQTEIVRPDRGERLPDTGDADLVALLGSDEAGVVGEREWIDREASWVRDHVRARTPVLGGSRRRAPAPEIGWIEVRSSDEDEVPAGPWFAWHADTIVAPPGAEVIARAGVGGRELAEVGLARLTLARQSADRAEASGAAARQLFDRFLRRADAFLPVGRGLAA